MLINNGIRGVKQNFRNRWQPGNHTTIIFTQTGPGNLCFPTAYSMAASACVQQPVASAAPKQSKRRVYFVAILGWKVIKLCLFFNFFDIKIASFMILGDRGTGKYTTVLSLKQAQSSLNLGLENRGPRWSPKPASIRYLAGRRWQFFLSFFFLVNRCR